MSRHLVTGGAGFIGSNLANRLIEQGEYVRVLDRFSRGNQKRLHDGARVTVGDVRHRETVEKAAQDADVIWHLAYVQGTQTFYADPKDVIDVALNGIVNVLNACENAPTPKTLILVSTSEVYQEPPAGMFPTGETVPLSVPDVTNPRYSYGGGKIASEIAALAYAQAGVLERAVIVRPHNIYGPDMGWEHVIPEFAERMLQLGPTERAFPIQGSGDETRSFCHITDCIDGLMIAYERGENRNVYHLGNPAEEHTIRDLAHQVAACYFRQIDVVAGQLPKGSPTRRLPDIAKLRALGFDPKVSLADGLPGTIDWYAANTRVPA